MVYSRLQSHSQIPGLLTGCCLQGTLGYTMPSWRQQMELESWPLSISLAMWTMGLLLYLIHTTLL